MQFQCIDALKTQLDGTDGAESYRLTQTGELIEQGPILRFELDGVTVGLESSNLTGSSSVKQLECSFDHKEGHLFTSMLSTRVRQVNRLASTDIELGSRSRIASG